MESFIDEDRQETVEDAVALEVGYILHTHNIRFHCPNEATEVLEQGPFWIVVVLKSLSIL